MPPKKTTSKSGEVESTPLRRSKRLVGSTTQSVVTKSPAKEKTIVVDKTPPKKRIKSLQKTVEESTQSTRRSKRSQPIPETDKKSTAKTEPKTKTKSPTKQLTAKSPVKTTKSPAKTTTKSTAKTAVVSPPKTKAKAVSKSRAKSSPKTTAKSTSVPKSPAKTTTKRQSKAPASIPADVSAEEPPQQLRKSKRSALQKPTETVEAEPVLQNKRTKSENKIPLKKRLKVVEETPEETSEEKTEAVIPQINENAEQTEEKTEPIDEKMETNDDKWEIIDEKKELIEENEDKESIDSVKEKEASVEPCAEAIEKNGSKLEENDIELSDDKESPPTKRQRKSRFEVPVAAEIGGNVYSFGDEIAGELGPRKKLINGVKVKMNEPSIVTGIQEKVVQVVCGAMHSVCLTVNGDVITFGCNDDAALGRQTSRIESNLEDSNDSDVDDSEEIAAATPEQVVGLPKIVKVSAGDMHTVALSQDGSVYVWGNFKDDSKKLGLTYDCVNKVDSEGKPMDDFIETNAPKLVDSLESTKIVDISSGCHHILLLTENGDVLSFGEGSKGQLGRIPKEKLQSVNTERQLFLNPQKVEFSDSNVVIEKIWSAHWSSFAQSINGDIYVWGLNNFHQLGMKTENSIELLNTDPNESQQSFKIIAELRPIKATKMPSNIKMIVNGQHHMLSLDTSGQVYSCGSSTYGKLGLSDSMISEDLTVESPLPISKDVFNGENVTHIACGEFCSFAITESGRLYSWGQGSKQIGTDAFEDLTRPTLVKGLMTESTHFLRVSSGSQHTTLVGNNTTLNGN